jgi:hypothetical protein
MKTSNTTHETRVDGMKQIEIIAFNGTTLCVGVQILNHDVTRSEGLRQIEIIASN